jgi:hypothetical protein
MDIAEIAAKQQLHGQLFDTICRISDDILATVEEVDWDSSK